MCTKKWSTMGSLTRSSFFIIVLISAIDAAWKPIVKQCPDTPTVHVGDTVSWTCDVGSKIVRSYEWARNHNPQTLSRTASFTKKVDTSDSGYYYCWLEYQAPNGSWIGTDWSDTMTINVTAKCMSNPPGKPTLLFSPSGQVNIGDFMTMVCQPDAGRGRPTSYEIDMKTGSTTNTWTTIANKSVYAMGAMALSDKGKMYRCRAKNDDGVSVESEIKTLIMKVIPHAPTIHGLDTSNTIEAEKGKSISLECLSSTANAFEWYRLKVAGKDPWEDVVGLRGNQLVIHKVTMEDGGAYRCRAKHGDVWSGYTTMMLIVIGDGTTPDAIEGQAYLILGVTLAIITLLVITIVVLIVFLVRIKRQLPKPSSADGSAGFHGRSGKMKMHRSHARQSDPYAFFGDAEMYHDGFYHDLSEQKRSARAKGGGGGQMNVAFDSEDGYYAYTCAYMTGEEMRNAAENAQGGLEAGCRVSEGGDPLYLDIEREANQGTSTTDDALYSFEDQVPAAGDAQEGLEDRCQLNEGDGPLYLDLACEADQGASLSVLAVRDTHGGLEDGNQVSEAYGPLYLDLEREADQGASLSVLAARDAHEGLEDGNQVSEAEGPLYLDLEHEADQGASTSNDAVYSSEDQVPATEEAPVYALAGNDKYDDCASQQDNSDEDYQEIDLSFQPVKA